MLHHISDKDPLGIPTNEDLKVSPTFLEKIILKYKNTNLIMDKLVFINDKYNIMIIWIALLKSTLLDRFVSDRTNIDSNTNKVVIIR